MLLFAAPAVFAQGILPRSVSNWRSSAVKPATPASLAAVAGANASVLKEYEAKSAEQRAYSRGGDSFRATVYTFEDPTGAYGAYSFLRAPDMAPAKLTKYSAMSRNRALALTGNLLLEFTGQDIARFHGELEMIVAQAGGHAQFGGYPMLPQRLPADGLVPRSDHYILGPIALQHFLPLAKGDWLGFSLGAEAEEAQYRLDHHAATLVIADFPTPQIAALQLQKLSREVDLGGKGPRAAGKPAIYARRDGTMLSVLADAPSKSSAEALLDQIRPGMAVIWDAPIFHKPQEPSMGTMIVGTIVGAGEICGFTLLGGLIFAALRLLIKRRWPGQVFDRPEDLEIIQLGLSSKPIKAKDLY